MTKEERKKNSTTYWHECMGKLRVLGLDEEADLIDHLISKLPPDDKKRMVENYDEEYARIKAVYDNLADKQRRKDK